MAQPHIKASLVRCLAASAASACISLLPLSACAIEFKAVGAVATVMFDAPSLKGSKVFIAPPGMPVEVVLDDGDWSRVRDVSGELAWVESQRLTARRMLIVEVPQATVRAAASKDAPVVFTAIQGVLLELAAPIVSDWIKVRHKDGELGFVKASEVWGE